MSVDPTSATGSAGSPTRFARPPFDPELATFLAALEARGPFTLTAEMLPSMRQLDVTEDALDERLRSHGYERGASPSQGTSATRSRSRSSNGPAAPERRPRSTPSTVAA